MMNKSFKPDELVKTIEGMSGTDYGDSFKEMRRKYLFERDGLSKKIVDNIL
jgi:hypothetical protein